MTLKERLLGWFGFRRDEPLPQITSHLSRRVRRHDFDILQVQPDGVYKVYLHERIQFVDMSDWRLFKRDLLQFCASERIQWSLLERGKIRIRCVGHQENVPKGIRYVWSFGIL